LGYLLKLKKKINNRKINKSLGQVSKAQKVQMAQCEQPVIPAAIDVVTFQEGIICVEGINGTTIGKQTYLLEKVITLQEYIALIIAAKGSYQSLGKAYNPNPVNPGMEITIQYMITGDNVEIFNNYLEKLIVTKNKQIKDAEKTSKR